MAQFYSPRRKATIKPQAKSVITVTATALDAFGQGVAKHQGKTLFISGLLPNEQAEVVLYEEKKSFAKGKVKRLLTQSEQRVNPACPHYSRCGGCQQQHVPLPLQQENKRNMLQRLMQNVSKNTVPSPLIMSGEQYGYRRRARLALQFNAVDHQLQLGFRQIASKEIIDIKVCPVLGSSLQRLIDPLRECLSSLKGKRRLGHVELVDADEGIVVVLRHLDPLHDSDRQILLAFAQQHQLIFYVAPSSDVLERIYGTAPHYKVCDVSLGFSPRDFIQVNDAINQQMVQQAINWLDLQATDRVLDLFCGMGNFTLPIAKFAQEVIGVEGVMSLVNQGRQNAKENGLDNVAFYHENLEEDVTKQRWAIDGSGKKGIDKVLLDPARDGAAGVIKQIITLKPKRIVYVSCNPATLARDSELLLNKGYELLELRMLDMFPNTSHLESMALFVKKE